MSILSENQNQLFQHLSPETQKFSSPYSDKEVEIILYRDPITQKIFDIQVPLTVVQRQRFLRLVKDQRVTPANASMTYLTQNHIADYCGKVESTIVNTVDARAQVMAAIRAATADFIPLEASMNQPSWHPIQDLDLLQEQVRKFKTDLFLKIQEIQQSSAQWSDDLGAKREIAEIIQTLINKIGKKIALFSQKIEELKKKNSTSIEVADFLKLQPSLGETSLGEFAQECMLDLLHSGIDFVHAIKEDTFWGRIKSHLWESTSGRSLSRAKRDIRQKFSLAGIGQNTLYPIDAEMLELLKLHSDSATVATQDDISCTRLQSLAPFLRSTNLEEIARIVSLALNFESEQSIAASEPKHELTPEKSYRFYRRLWRALTIVAIVPDIGYAALRLPIQICTIVVGGVVYATQSVIASVLRSSGLASSFPALYRESDTHQGLLQSLSAFDQFFSDRHQTASKKLGILGSKQAWSKYYQYKIPFYAERLRNIHQPTNAVHHILQSLNSAQVVPYLAQQLSPIVNFLVSPIVNVVSFIQSFWLEQPRRNSLVMAQQKQADDAKDNASQKVEDMLCRQENQREEIDPHNQNSDQNKKADERNGTWKKKDGVFDDGRADLWEETESDSPHHSSLAKTQLKSQVDVSEESAEKKERGEVFSNPSALVYPIACLALTTNIANPSAVPNGVMLLLSQIIRDAFCEAAGPATLGFATAMLTLGTAMLPPLIAALGATQVAAGMQSIASIQVPASFIAQNFMGQSFSSGMLPQLFATFLEWKFIFFGTEAIKSIAESDYDFLNRIFADPEQLVIGMALCIMIGHALGQLPLLPAAPTINGYPLPGFSVYQMGFDSIIIEANDCEQAAPVLNSLEFSFLGLKSLMLLHSMVHGIRPQNTEAILSSHMTLDEVLNRIQKNPSYLKNKAFGRWYYNYLAQEIERHNTNMCLQARDDRQFDQDGFIRRQIFAASYPGSPNFFRVFYLIPLVYLTVCAWRYYKSPPALWSKITGHQPEAYTQAQVAKSFAKDRANFIDCFACAIVAPSVELMRAMQYLTRAIVAAVPYTLFTSLYLTIGLINAGMMLSGSKRRLDPTPINNTARWFDNNVIRRIRFIDYDLPEWVRNRLPSVWHRVRKVYAGAVEQASTAAAIEIAQQRGAMHLKLAEEKSLPPASSVTGVVESRYFCHFFKKRAPLQSLVELAQLPKTKRQQEILIQLATRKAYLQQCKQEEFDSDQALPADVQKLLKQLPQHWHEVVKSHYLYHADPKKRVETFKKA